MALYVNGSEIENVYVGGQKIDRVFANGTLVYESTIYVAKPTVTGAYTYNGGAQAAIISGYDSAAMTMSGTTSATDAGVYHVYFELNKGYAWADGATGKLDYTWNIAKKVIAVPKLSATNFVWVEGDTHTVTVSGLDTSYVNQSGTLSQIDTSSNIGTSNTITWSLKNAASTQWADDTTVNKSAAWSSTWVNGTSHYKNDWYNRGWNSGTLTSFWSNVDWGNASKPYITVSKSTSGKVSIICAGGMQSSVIPIHVLVAAASSDTAWTRLACVNSSASTLNAYKPKATAQTYNLGTSYTELYGTTADASGSHYQGIVFSGDPEHYIQRIWHD